MYHNYWSPGGGSGHDGPWWVQILVRLGIAGLILLVVLLLFD